MTPIQSVQHWLQTVVIELNLCPFAKRERDAGRVRFYESAAHDIDQLLIDLQTEFEHLNGDSSIETTLLIHPYCLQDFADYNQFLNLADALLFELDLEGTYQIASFHPHYQFADTAPDDVENHTNRSPYPILHLIREASLEKALASTPDTDKIPERNIALLRTLGKHRMRELLAACYGRKPA
jgi:hypothetical protein